VCQCSPRVPGSGFGQECSPRRVCRRLGCGRTGWEEFSAGWSREELAGVKYLAELNAAEVEGASETEDVLSGVFWWWKLAGDGSTLKAP
jgi:hypothetical protein